MQPQKRKWIYGGLAHPPSVVLARPVKVRKRLPAGSKLLLAGDEHAWALAPFLRRLSQDGDVEQFVALQRDGATLAGWAASKRLATAVEEHRPDIILLSLPHVAEAADAIDELARHARKRAGTFVWVRSPERDDLSRPFRLQLDAAKVPSFHSESLDIHRGTDGQPSARGYAGWAGALWRWIG